MPINQGDSKASVKSTIDTIITNAGLSAAGDTNTTVSTVLLNQVAAIYGLPGLADGMAGAQARTVINNLEIGSVFLFLAYAAGAM